LIEEENKVFQIAGTDFAYGGQHVAGCLLFYFILKLKLHPIFRIKYKLISYNHYLLFLSQCFKFVS